MIKLRASAAAFVCGAFPLAFAAFSPAPASADPMVIPAPDYVPRGRAVVRPAQAYGDDEVRVVRPDRRTYGRRAYVEEIFEDDPRIYRSVRRIPTYRERTGRDYYGAGEPRRVYGREAPARRYYDEEYSYETIEPEVERYPRRLAGPPSALGASEARGAMDPKFARAVVPYSGPEAPNTIVINTRTRYLYLVQSGGSAIRYGVGVGKEGFEWKGTQTISAKREWPNWHPPAEMRARRPELPVMMEGGPDNPLGARALYLGDTLYRIHGSNEPWTIGRAVSSGCIRMTNDDVTDLYDRVGVGTAVKVM